MINLLIAYAVLTGALLIIGMRIIRVQNELISKQEKYIKLKEELIQAQRKYIETLKGADDAVDAV